MATDDGFDALVVAVFGAKRPCELSLLAVGQRYLGAAKGSALSYED